jgi:uroporphyrin-III C-methyltransferase
MSQGLVSIVGAGPGDPGLLTLKAADRLRRADAVVYDALVSPEVLALTCPRAKRFFVGKRSGLHVLPQKRINALLLRLARQGLRVVRLKGGDPFVFGRGGEECEMMAKAGVPWEVVPGVSSCLAAAAAAGIPVTDRRFSSMVTVVSGHTCAEAGQSVDWERLSPSGTLVVLMGFSNLAPICQKLIGLGWPPRTPAAALSSMGWPSERVAVAELESLPAKASALQLRAPAVIVVGEVVRLRGVLGRAADKEESCQTKVSKPRRPRAFTFQRPRSSRGMPARFGPPGRSPVKSTRLTSSSGGSGTKS